MKNLPAMCFAYHPGSMITELSKAYVSPKSVSDEAGVFEADRAAEKFMGVLKGIREEENGSFIDWAGKKVGW